MMTQAKIQLQPQLVQPAFISVLMDKTPASGRLGERKKQTWANSLLRSWDGPGEYVSPEDVEQRAFDTYFEVCTFLPRCHRNAVHGATTQ